jgi:hypothetical protein
MNYRATVAEIRSSRDREITRIREDAAQAATSIRRVKANAGAAVAAARAARDSTIRTLHEQGLLGPGIARELGCDVTIVYEVLRPEAHERYNRRRRDHWRRHLRAVGE